MRPISLTMQAFGSYGEKTTIDFTKPVQNLFLITGNTGAGKTTIFDAIVFALYGKDSSADNVKDGKDLQSQFAGTDVEPFVELVFSEDNGLNEEIYTVRRVPKHVRAKKRGDGQIDEKEKASLVMPDESEYSNNLAETNEKLEEVVGLDKEQFMQVAMIAQGGFMELLRAKSNDKKEIFRKLFDTELYDKIVVELKRRCDDKLGEIEQIRTICQAEIGRVVVPSDDESAQDLLDLQNRILSSERLNIVDVDEFLDQLQLLCERLRKKEGKAKRKNSRAEKDRDKKRDKLTKAKSMRTAFEQAEGSRKELDACKKAGGEIEEADRLANAIDVSYEIKSAYDRYEDAARTVELTSRKLSEQRNTLPALEQKHQEVLNLEDGALQEKERRSETYTATDERVKKAGGVFDEIKAEARVRKKAEDALRKAEKDVEEAKRNLENFGRQVRDWNKQKEELEDTGRQLEECLKRREDLDGIAEDVEALEKAQQDLTLQKNKLDEAKRGYESARGKYEQVNAEYEGKRNAFFDAQAGFIAKEKLVEDEPCPVCGSLDHPSPCALSQEHRELTREALDELEGEVSKCRKAQQDRSEESRSAAVVLEEKKGSYEKDLEKLRANIAKILPDAPRDLSLESAGSLVLEQRKALGNQEKDLAGKADRLAEIEKDLSTADAKDEELRGRSEDAAEALNAAKEDVSAGNTALRTLEAQKSYSTEKEAEEALAQAKADKEAADAAYASAHEASQTAQSALQNAKTLIEKFTEELPAQEAAEADLRKEYEALLREKDLAEKDWQATVDQYTKEQSAVFRDEVNAHGEKQAAAQRAYQNAMEQIGDEQRPNTKELKADVAKAEDNLKAARVAYAEISENLVKNEEVCQNLAPTMAARTRIVQEHAQIENLYKRLAGKVSGSRMDIETFVQRYYLQQILAAANARFREMSGGQFELRMIDEEQAEQGRTNQGLDLTVYSTVTGTEREVGTLSGGESFMAALSMALGMADQIRLNSAAINLDVMFIDEGFGFLDDYARSQAVRVLQNMAGGEKLVGIISHVTELKQQIDDQLIVTRDEKGSHTRWQVS